MRKKLIVLIAVVMIVMLTGCSSAGTEVVLESVTQELVSEDSVTAKEPETAASDSSFDRVAEAMSDGATMVGMSDGATESSKAVQVVVYVCGAVCEAGVYELPDGSRLDDAVQAAGGFDEEADRTYVNLAALCSDGMKLYIPTKQEVAEARGGTAVIGGSPNTFGADAGSFSSSERPGNTKNGLVNINTASKEELTTLPGIGAGYADRIIAYRCEKGPFKSIEDIMKVSGIKEKLFSKIRDQITV